jgi:serine/threonine protein kinase
LQQTIELQKSQLMRFRTGLQLDADQEEAKWGTVPIFRARSTDEFHFSHRLGSDLSGHGYQGVNSAVYAASHARCPRPLAVKILYNIASDSSASTVDIHRNFEQETEIMKQVPPHVNLLPILTSFVADLDTSLLPSWSADSRILHSRTLFVVTEQMDTTLQTLISKRQGMMGAPPFFSRRIIFHYARRMLRAVDHLNSNFIAHRDLKPDNILLGGPLVSDMGDLSVPAMLKVSDFGSAWDLRGNQSLCVPFLAAFPRGGAPTFLPPEIVNPRPGRGSVLDYRKADSWAVGKILYQMLAGEEPFTTEDNRTISDATYVPISEDYDEDIQSFVRELLRPDLNVRLSTKDALAFLDAQC